MRRRCTCALSQHFSSKVLDHFGLMNLPANDCFLEEPFKLGPFMEWNGATEWTEGEGGGRLPFSRHCLEKNNKRWESKDTPVRDLPLASLELPIWTTALVEYQRLRHPWGYCSERWSLGWYNKYLLVDIRTHSDASIYGLTKSSSAGDVRNPKLQHTEWPAPSLNASAVITVQWYINGLFVVTQQAVQIWTLSQLPCRLIEIVRHFIEK